MSEIERCLSSVTYIYGGTDLPDSTHECDREAGHSGAHIAANGLTFWFPDGRTYPPAVEVQVDAQ